MSDSYGGAPLGGGEYPPGQQPWTPPPGQQPWAPPPREQPSGEQPWAPQPAPQPGEPAAPAGPAWPAVPVFDIVPAGPAGRPPRGPSRRPALLVAATVAVVVALVAAGAGVRQLVRPAATDASPASVAPGSTFAYLQFDLDPPAKQRLDLFNFTRRFPGSPTNRPGASADTARDTLLAALFDESSVRYDTDFKPWLGRYAGLAGFRDDTGRPRIVVILGVRDRSAAESAMTRIAAVQHQAYAFDGDYAVLAQDQRTLAAAQAPGQGTLADSATFGADTATLPAGQLLTAWVDIKASIAMAGSYAGNLLCRSMRAALAGAAPQALPGRPGGACTGQEVQRMVTGGGTGRIVLGASVASDHVDVQLRALGGAAAPAAAVAPMVDRLPSDTAVAFGVSGVDRQLRKQQRSLSGLYGLGMLGMGGRSVDQAWQRTRRQIHAKTGLSFPGDFAALVGDRTVLAMPAQPLERLDQQGRVPQLGLRSHPRDLAAARRLANRFAAAVAGDAPVSVRTAGSDLVVASGAGYAARLGAAGGLGGSARYRAAVGTTAGASVVAYVDLRGIGVSRAQVPVSAVGLVVRNDGHGQLVELRVVAD